MTELVPAAETLHPRFLGGRILRIVARQSHSARISIDHSVNDLVNILERQFALRGFIFAAINSLALLGLLGLRSRFVRLSASAVGIGELLELSFELCCFD